MASGSKGATTADNERKLRRLRRYNPFVNGLADRRDNKQQNFEFFDSKERLVSLPMVEFDGYPLEGEYRYFIPVLFVVAVGVTLPLLPLYRGATWYMVVTAAVIYGALVAILAVFIVFRMVSVRNEYNAANRSLEAANFATKARGIRNVVHEFKFVMRWRRFMRYTMNSAGVCLIAAFLFASYEHILHRDFLSHHFLKSLLLFGVGASSILLFELARRLLTRGMDPTLALVLMVEEIGGQLLARSHLIGTSGDGTSQH